jgi:hypothetical protein
MSDNNNGSKPLNLDELFGQASHVKVTWQGKTYELLRMEAISPRQAVQFNRLKMRANDLQNADEEMSNKQANDLEKVIDEMLILLCKDLPLSTMEFIVKLRVLVYYTEQTQGKKALDLALGTIQKRTGARSSRA